LEFSKGEYAMTGNDVLTRGGLGLVVAALCLNFSLSGSAQVQTDTSTTSGKATKQVKVEQGQVVTVSGNDLVVKMQDGTIRHFANVPESTRVTVDGKQLGIHDLKPGMTLQRTITTTTTPKIITTTKSVTGKVWFVNPPNSVILTLEDGKNQEFKIPRGQKFDVNGQMTDAWGLQKGMMVSATKVVEQPETVVAQTAKITGQMPPPPAPPPADVPILVAVITPEPAPAPVVAQAAPAALPKTGSELPLLGLLGVLSLVSALGLRVVRKAA
jgi:LPXTG-motif cell wall-anchored protein